MLVIDSEWHKLIKKAEELLKDPNVEIVWFDKRSGIVLRSAELEIAIRLNPPLGSIKFYTVANNKKLEI